MLFQLLTTRRAPSEDTLVISAALRSCIVLWRGTMTTGFPMLDLGLVVAVFAGVFYWMYSLSSRSHAERLEKLRAKKQAHQPWDPNTTEGRRNRQ
jgi:hypothetical protein